MASTGVMSGWVDMMIDIAFHTTPLVTAVGQDESVFVSSWLFELIRGIIGITIFPLSLSNHTGIALLSHQYSLNDGEK